MALTQCPECAKTVSDQAVSCPSCGYVLNQPKEKHEQVTNASAVLFLAGLVALCFVGFLIITNTGNLPLAGLVVIGGIVGLFVISAKSK